jgi:5-enolpyruvylshikimate-3-phosphate synthase
MYVPPGDGGYPPDEPRRRGWLVFLAVLLLLAALAGGGYLLARSAGLVGPAEQVTVPDVAGRSEDAARSALEDEGLRVTGGGTLLGIDADLHEVGELTPAVAALCALAETPSRLRGIGHIRGHETDRLAALATELGGLGAEVTEHADGLAFEPAALHGGVFHTYADHRMAHAGVIVGAAVEDVLVEDIATTGKTFPDFAAFWSGLVPGVSGAA